MSTEQAKQFVERAKSDEEFRTRLSQTPAEDRAALLHQEGYGDVRGEHFDQLRSSGELSDDELDAVSGGNFDKFVEEWTIGENG